MSLKHASVYKWLKLYMKFGSCMVNGVMGRRGKQSVESRCVFNSVDTGSDGTEEHRRDDMGLLDLTPNITVCTVDSKNYSKDEK